MSKRLVRPCVSTAHHRAHRHRRRRHEFGVREPLRRPRLGASAPVRPQLRKCSQPPGRLGPSTVTSAPSPGAPGDPSELVSPIAILALLGPPPSQNKEHASADEEDEDEDPGPVEGQGARSRIDEHRSGVARADRRPLVGERVVRHRTHRAGSRIACRQAQGSNRRHPRDRRPSSAGMTVAEAAARSDRW